jgi:hypothetical protein
MLRRIVPLILVAAIAPAANAATPFPAGTGTQPSVAVGSDGVGHVVWETAATDIDIGYCRVPMGATACDKSTTLDLPSGARSSGRAMVFTPSAGKVVVVGGCHNCPGLPDRLYQWTSNNNGDTFAAPVAIGNATDFQGRGMWLDNLGIFAVATASRVKATDASLPAGDGVPFSSSGIFVYGTQVVRLPTTNKLVAAADDLNSIKFGVYTGNGTLAQMNNASNWILDGTLPDAESDNSQTGLNAGPAGVFLSYENQTSVTTPHVAIRRFDPVANAFGGPTYVEGGDAIDHNGTGYVASTQDATGRVHVLWRSLFDDGRLRYVVSDASGANFSVPATIAAKEAFYEPAIAAGPAGTGFAAWTLGASGDVRIVPLDPQAESTPVTPPGGGGTGGGTPGGGTPGPAYIGPLSGRPVNVAGGTITFLTPSSCVHPGQTFKVRLKFKKRKRKGNVVIKIFRTDFYRGTKIVKKDRRPPFVHTFKVRTSQIPGSSITLRARAWMKVRHGKPPKKSIRATIRVCA